MFLRKDQGIHWITNCESAMSYCYEKAKPFKGFRAWVSQVRHVSLQRARCVLVPHFKKHVSQQGEVQARWTKNNHGLETKKKMWEKERKSGCAHLSMQEHGNWVTYRLEVRVKISVKKDDTKLEDTRKNMSEIILLQIICLTPNPSLSFCLCLWLRSPALWKLSFVCLFAPWAARPALKVNREIQRNVPDKYKQRHADCVGNQKKAKWEFEKKSSPSCTWVSRAESFS